MGAARAHREDGKNMALVAAYEERRAAILSDLKAGRVRPVVAARRLKALSRFQEAQNRRERSRASRTAWAWLALIKITYATKRERTRRLYLPILLPLLWPLIPLVKLGLRIAARRAGNVGFDLASLPVAEFLTAMMRACSGTVFEVNSGRGKVEIIIW
jgi:hypothetical protein